MKETNNILVLNLGSTSTKVAVYQNKTCLVEEDLHMDRDELAKCADIFDQYNLRSDTVKKFLERNGKTLQEMDWIVARGTAGSEKLEAGCYLIDEKVLEANRKWNVRHVAKLGPEVAYRMGQEVGIPAYLYDSDSLDEACDFARLSGLKEFPCKPSNHPLNTRAVARKAAEDMGGKYEDYTFIIAHLGGGLTVGLHEHGKIVDANSEAFTAERSGSMPMSSTMDFVNACYNQRFSKIEMIKMIMGNGGLYSYTGVSNLKEAMERVHAGDEEMEFYVKGMAYHIAKDIAGLAAPACGKIDRIILTGGMAYCSELCQWISDRVSFIAPVEIYAGAMEMEALALGSLRAVSGEEPIKTL